MDRENTMHSYLELSNAIIIQAVTKRGMIMRFFHLSDLHIGKQFHYYNLKEDQEYMLKQVVEKAKEYKPDAVVIAGDIYDKSVPSAEAVSIFNQFLTELSEIEPAIPIMVIAGNHDSPQRLDYAREILDRQKIYIAGLPPRKPEEYMKKVTLKDSYGEVHFYLLPFVKPGYVRNVFPEDAVDSYDDAVKMLIFRENVNTAERNVIVSHQFYTSNGKEPVRSESETVNVGGLDNIDVSALDVFDYAALGHIHRGQKSGNEKNRYCGTLLKYSVSEEKDEKQLCMVELKEKGSEVTIQKIPLYPLRDVKRLRGKLEQILIEQDSKKDYVSVTITDEIEPYRMREQLEAYFPYLLEIRIDNTRTKTSFHGEEPDVSVKNPLDTFAEFFAEMQGRELTEPERKLLEDIMEESGE